MNSRSRNRSGLTILDVVVTIVILLVLAALLLPATRSPRSAARRSQCKNNLKQIGLAIMNYHDVHRVFPPGWIAAETPQDSSGFGWHYQVLPYFDAAPLFTKFDAKQKLSNKACGNADLASTILTAARCPSDAGLDQGESGWMSPLGTTNYVGNFGVGLPTTYSTLAGSEGKIVDSKYLQGIFGPNSSVRIKDVKDGMSNVVLVGERRMPHEGVEWPISKSDGRFNSYWAGIPNIAAVNPLVVVATATGGQIELNGEHDKLPATGNLAAVMSQEERKSLPYFVINKNPRLGVTLSGDHQDMVTAGFSSWHTGGCQMVLGDGTVRFISENIDATVYTNLMRRSDGATLGEF